ncbi:DEAD/DEAH box helicase family protein [Oceanobacillus oncorhynchi]|uniref:DEAD/DEAH box helicase family protein n=1 Tax=Oceanobacillus oncorhynchi TaxID=545501 RepID=UPI0018695B03|nr:DEAD/DEAH box helicase family protein [Oceanobacillus oncorhynchi]
MESFPERIQFKYSWRSYQQAIIDDMDTYLNKRHLHLVAPPGSGKTVIGLEMMLRFNQPALILAPTIAIRDQWVARFVELFDQSGNQPEWMTTDLKEKALVTVATYQGFHQWMTGQEEEVQEKLASYVKTLVLDEAHHLRTAWWRSAVSFRKNLTNPAIVALTATPPYDVSIQEWNRYLELCGEIDAEISIAELVREAELAPFQDYVWISDPLHEEQEEINQFRSQVIAFQKSIRHNPALIDKIEAHPWITDPDTYAEEILSEPAYLSSMLIFLKEVESTAWTKPLPIMGLKKKQIPEWSLEWLELMLTHLLYQDKHIMDEEEPVRKEIQSYLQRLGAVEKRRVVLTANDRINRLLVQSPSKLNSIQQVTAFEAQELGTELRQVILTDYIRREDLPKKAEDEQDLRRLGAIPVFEQLRRRELDVSLGVLTGSIVIIPKKVLAACEDLAEQWDVAITAAELSYDASYVEITINTSARHRMVQMMTKLFERGEITVLIGTAALLGEGWDAPFINSLVLASYVGSFMLSNQMRGRAIRVEKNNPQKTANIWHLVCLDATNSEGGEDYLALKRRFKALIGLGHQKNVIQTGIGRLSLAEPPFYSIDKEQSNRQMCDLARERGQLFQRWKSAVEIDGTLKEEVSTQKQQLPRPLLFTNTIKALILAILSIIFFFVDNVLGEITNFRILEDNFRAFLWVVVIIIAISLIIASPFIWRLLKILFRNISVEKSMSEVGTIVYQALFESSWIETKPAVSLIQTEEENGVITCWLENAPIYEQKIYVEALREVLDPLESPRYIVVRKQRTLWWNRIDYHAVPAILAQNKEMAELFLACWEKHLGKAELVYTRTPEGRQVLLQARAKAMSAQFVSKSEQISVWK